MPSSAEHRVELVVVIGREHDPVMQGSFGQLRRQILQCQEQHKAGQRRRRSPQAAKLSLRDRPGEKVPVDPLRIGVGHHDLGGNPQAISRDDPNHSAASLTDLRDPHPRAHGHAVLERTLQNRGPERAQPAPHVPGSEGLFGVGNGGKRGRRPARIASGVGGVAVEHGAQARVTQSLRAK